MDTVAIKTAFVLAGGKGERLRPLTDKRPKPMVEVNGAPLVHHHLQWLRDNGIERAFLLTGYQHHVVSKYFDVPRIEGLAVRCIAEDSPLGRGGAFRNGLNHADIEDQLIIGTNGDVITDQALDPIAIFHAQRRPRATVMLTPMVSPYGTVSLDENGMIIGFLEKPTLPLWINAGVYVLDRALVSEFPAQGDHEVSTFPALAESGQLAGFQSLSYWRSVESMKDVRDVAEYLADKRI